MSYKEYERERRLKDIAGYGICLTKNTSANDGIRYSDVEHRSAKEYKREQRLKDIAENAAQRLLETAFEPDDSAG